MAEFDLKMEFSHGWCTLALGLDGRTVSIKNHWANDRVSELVRCVNILLDGTESVSCRWQGPVQEGHFIDLVADPGGGLSLAVHQFRHPEGSDFSEIWSAERGKPLICGHLALADFTVAFAAALRRVRATTVDASGMITGYPRPFPQADFKRIETKAAKFGYHSKPLSEFEDVSNPSA